jgi:hypothetical protein
VDVEGAQYAKYLKRLGLREKPSNLRVRGRTSSVDYLKTVRSNSLDHQWAHFTATAMRFYVRREFFAEVFRTLKKGGKFTIVDSAMSATQLLRELTKAGFSCSLKRLNVAEAKKLDTPYMDWFAREQEAMRKSVLGADGKIDKNMVAQMRQAWIQIHLLREGKVTGEVRAALQSAADNMEKTFSEQPYCRIVAVKRK